MNTKHATNSHAKTAAQMNKMRLPELQAYYQEVVGESTRCPNRTWLIRKLEEAAVAQAKKEARKQELAQASREAPVDEAPPAPQPEATPAASAVPAAETPPESAPASIQEAEPVAVLTQEPTLPDEGPAAAHAAQPALAELDATEAEPATTDADADQPEVDHPAAAPAESTPKTRAKRGRFASMTVEELQAKYLEVVGRATGSSDVAYLIWKIREAEKGRIPLGPRQTRRHAGEPLDMKILPLRMEAQIVDRMDEAWRARGIKNRMEFFRQALGHYLVHLGAQDAAAMFGSAAE